MPSFRFRGAALIGALSALALSAQTVPATLNYQGRLTDNGTTPAPVTATVNMRFEIWDVASGGTATPDRLWVEPASGTVPVSVTGGIFSVMLGGNGVPLPASLFTGGSTRWLQIVANGETLAPRQALAAAAYANQAQNAASATSATDSAALGGLAASSYQRAITESCGAGYFIHTILSDGSTACAAASASLVPPVVINHTGSSDVLDVTQSGTGSAGAFTISNGASTSPALYAYTSGTGAAVAANGTSNAVYGYSNGTALYGVTYTGVAVQGYSSGAGYPGRFINGDASSGYPALQGTTPGSGAGVSGSNTNTTGIGIGVEGTASSAYSGSAGVKGYSADGYGVLAQSGSSIALEAESGSSYGVFARTGSATSAGIRGYNTTNGNEGSLGGGSMGAQGICNTSGCNAVYGQANSLSDASSAVYARNFSPSGYGVYAYTEGGSAQAGVYGSSSASGGNGVIGEASGGTGAYGVWGKSTVGYAGYFSGKVQVAGNLAVSGTLSKGGGSFKIDHPLDPENKYLYHSFVESPDMMNLYNGTVVTDARGYAEVALPEWFGALNRDFRYQLTVIGEEFAQAIVAKKIERNRFTIRTNRPGVEVSWQVTGIRKDAFANAHRIPVEEDKPAQERGRYLHPEAFGRPAEDGITAAGEKPIAKPGPVRADP